MVDFVSCKELFTAVLYDTLLLHVQVDLLCDTLLLCVDVDLLCDTVLLY